MSQWDSKGQSSGLNVLGKSGLEFYSNINKCGVHKCREKAPTFHLYACRHFLCTRCLVKTRTSIFQKDTDVCICTLCKNTRYPAWFECSALVTKMMHMKYCTSCLAEKAVFKSRCGHLLCQNCLKEIDRTHTSGASFTCTSSGCKQETPYSELREGLENMTDTMIWCIFDIAKFEHCDKLCGNKAIVKIKECGHCYCFPCCDLKISNSTYDKSGKISCLKRSNCATIMSQELLEAFLKQFKDIPLMTALSLRVSLEKCCNKNCRQKNLDTIRIRNRLCSYFHVHCINCLEEKLESSDCVVEPYLQSNWTGDLISCTANSCKTRTPVKCLEAVINVVKHKDKMSVLFLRRAIFFEECRVCRKANAMATCMLCSHGFCRKCMEAILEANEKEYNTCDVKNCFCLLPVVVFKIFLNKMSAKCSSESSTQRVESDGRSASEAEIVLQISMDKMNRSFVLNAEVKSAPVLRNALWLKNARPLDIRHHTKYVEIGMLTATPQLMICGVKKEDEGFYKLVLSDENETVSSNDVEFSILGKDLPSVSIEVDFDGNQQQGILIADIETEWPIEHVHWLYKGTQINRTDMGKKFIEEASSSTRKQRKLYIKNLQRSDEGEYACEVETIAGKVTSPPMLVTIPKDPPSVSIKADFDDTHQHGIMIADIETNWPVAHVHWLYKGKQINRTDIGKKFIEEASSSRRKQRKLYIKNFKKPDEGEYACEVETIAGKGTSSPVSIRIPQVVPSVSLSLSFNEKGRSLLLSAEVVSSSPTKPPKWIKDGKQMLLNKNSPRYLESRHLPAKPSITVFDVGEDDEGMYTVSVENEHGVGISERKYFNFPKQIKETYIVKTQLNASKSKASTGTLKDEAMIDCQTAEQSYESRLVEIKRPYVHRVDCEICCKTAVATVRNCGHSYCLECLQCVAGTCAYTTINCPKEGGCSSIITKDTFREFIKKPHILHLEMPLYFKVAFGNCKGITCSKEGIIQMTRCNHSLCFACLEKCKSKKKCISGDCINQDIPPSRYFEYLKHVFMDKDESIIQIPYLLEVSRYSKEADIKCCSCSERAMFEIIPCTHKFCDRCFERDLHFPDSMFVFRKCAMNGCNVWYPFHKKLQISDRPKDITGTQAQEKKTDERETSPLKPAIEHLSFGASRGLRNIAFSCYRNSILQILAETPKFYDHLLESYSTETENWIPLLKDILLRIRNQMTAGKEMVDILCHFHSEFNISNTEYKEYQQEDTLSFLTTVLNGINDRYGQMGKEGITAFKGRLRHRFYCKKCGKEDGFNDDDFLSLPLPTESTVEKCLLEFLQEEPIDALSCSHCGSQPISKQLQICKYPDVLVLQLNKSTSSFSRAVKVKFPESLKNMEDKDLMKVIKKKDIWSYKLYGVVVHSGNEYSGHYISYVRRQSKSSWDKCDDSYVTPVSVKDVLRCDPYLLFYEKCDSEV